MCEYCKRNELGDADGDEFIRVSLDMPLKEKLELSIDLTAKGELLLFGNYTSGDGDALGKVKINYCPMCGRKL